MTALDVERVGDAVVVAHTDDMDRAEWLDERQRGIGGSDAATICGLNDYCSPYELWCDKALGPSGDDDNEAAFWGRTLEPVVLNETARRENLDIVPVPAILAHPLRPWQMANIDGTALDLTGRRPGPGVYEGKTAGLWSASQWADDQVPERYVIQGMHYLAVTGWDWVAFSCLIGGQRLVTRYVERDTELIDQLIELEARFWQQVQDHTPPTPDGSKACTEFLNNVAATTGKTITVDADIVQPLIARRAAAKAVIAEAEAEQAAVENQLRALLGDAEVALDGDGRKLVTWKTQTRTDIDRSRAKAAGPFLDELYTTTTHRRFHFPKAKDR